MVLDVRGLKWYPYNADRDQSKHSRNLCNTTASHAQTYRTHFSRTPLAHSCAESACERNDCVYSSSLVCHKLLCLPTCSYSAALFLMIDDRLILCVREKNTCLWVGDEMIVNNLYSIGS